MALPEGIVAAAVVVKGEPFPRVAEAHFLREAVGAVVIAVAPVVDEVTEAAAEAATSAEALAVAAAADAAVAETTVQLSTR